MKRITSKAQHHLLAGGMILTCLGTTLSLSSQGSAQPSERPAPSTPQPTSGPQTQSAPPPGGSVPPPLSLPAPPDAPPIMPRLQAPTDGVAPTIAPEKSQSTPKRSPLALPPVAEKGLVPERSTRAVGPITGTGTTGTISKFTGANAIGNSVLNENGGRIGLGTKSPVGLLGVISGSATTPAIQGTHSSTAGDGPAIVGDSSSTSSKAVGVQGTITSTAPGAYSAGLRGINSGTSANGFGVYGSHSGGGAGVFGTATTGVGVLGNSAQGTGVRGSYTGTSGTNPGVMGQTLSTTSGSGGTSVSAAGVTGVVVSTNPGSYSAGVRGINNGTGSSGVGVYGSHAGAGIGVYGYAPQGYGLYARSDTGYGAVTSSSSSYGLYSSSSSGTGIYGSSSSGIGVSGYSPSYYGVYGNAPSGTGVVGKATGGNGVSGTSSTGYGVVGSGQFGVYGSGSSSGSGVYGLGYVGLEGHANGTSSSQAIRGDNGGSNTVGYAGYFNGRVQVRGDLAVYGTLSKSSGSFKIDHPLHPGTEYLSHSFVESPDMMNVYNGNVTLDAKGEAVVKLPDYFQALNRDFRYQLTSIGQPAMLYVAKEISGNQFAIAGGKAGMKVSWQVTGVRQDAYARDHRISVEETKGAADQGKYLYPAGFGAGNDKLIGAEGARVAAR